MAEGPAWLAGCVPEARLRSELELEQWARERGWQVGPRQGVSPQGLSSRPEPLTKWRALSAAQVGRLDAIAVWSADGREVVVWVRATLAEAVPARHHHQINMFGRSA